MKEGIERRLSQAVMNGNIEKSYTDKLTAKDEMNDIRQIFRKSELNRSDLHDILSLMASSETKLVQFNEWERYIVLKLFVWLREFCKIMELMIDYKDYLETKHKAGDLNFTDRAKVSFNNAYKTGWGNARAIVELYFMIMRTSLSINGRLISDLTKDKFEIQYQNDEKITQVAPVRQGWFK